MQFISNILNVPINRLMGISALIKGILHVSLVLIYIVSIIRTYNKWEQKDFNSFEEVENYFKYNYYFNTTINLIISLITAILLIILSIRYYLF